MWIHSLDWRLVSSMNQSIHVSSPVPPYSWQKIPFIRMITLKKLSRDWNMFGFFCTEFSSCCTYRAAILWNRSCLWTISCAVLIEIFICAAMSDSYVTILVNKLICAFNVAHHCHCHWSFKLPIIKDQRSTSIEHWDPSAHILGIHCIWTIHGDNFLMNFHSTIIFLSTNTELSHEFLQGHTVPEELSSWTDNMEQRR